MESDKKWVNRPESAYSSSTKSVLIAMVVIFITLIIGALFFLHGKL